MVAAAMADDAGKLAAVAAAVWFRDLMWCRPFPL